MPTPPDERTQVGPSPPAAQAVRLPDATEESLYCVVKLRQRSSGGKASPNSNLYPLPLPAVATRIKTHKSPFSAVRDREPGMVFGVGRA